MEFNFIKEIEKELPDVPISNRKNRRITFEERKKIEMYLRQGYSQGEISRKLPRPQPSVYFEINNNSFNGVYKAEKAQELYDERQKIRISTLLQCRTPRTYKITSLKAQVDLLTNRVNSLESCIKTLAEVVESQSKAQKTIEENPQDIQY